MRCGFCLEMDHLKSDCPMLLAVHVRPDEPRTTADDVNDQLAARMLEYRTLKNALLGYARERGWTFPEPILQLDPDHTP